MAELASLRRWRALAATLVVSLAALGSGCGSDASEAGPSGGGAAGGGGGPADPISLAFASETLTMIPAERQTVTITATPPGVYRLRFALVGDARDASLDVSEIDTDESGAASVELTAPTESTTFTLRASSGESVATAGVSVSASGFATLQVQPIYSGKRTVSYWVASVRTGTTCAELSTEPLSDGDLKGSAVLGQVPQVLNVPVGPALAVTLRGAWSIAGCLDVSAVRAGLLNSIEMTVSDLPMQLSETDLGLELGLEKASPVEWSLAFEDLAKIVFDAFRDGAPNDISALLSAMQLVTATPSDAAAFAATSSAEQWELVASGALGSGSVLSNQIKLWMTEGAQALGGPETFTGVLRPSGKYPGKATLELTSVAGMPPLEAGFRVTNGNDEYNQWTAEPGDNVLFGVRLVFAPSQLATAIAKAPALASVPGATSVPEALAQKLGCVDLATALVATGQNPKESFLGCDLACTTLLCEQALDEMWTRARQASLDVPNAAWVNVTASGAAVVDDHARPMSFSGSWVGGLKVGETTVPLTGSASGSLPPPPS